MQLQNWVKTLFSVYNCFDNLIQSIDKFIKLKSYSCFSPTLESFSKVGTLRVFNDITALMNKKIIILNLKRLVEKLLQKVNLDVANILISTYIEERTSLSIANELGKSERKIQRMRIEGVEQATKALRKMNLDWQNLYKMCESEEWLIKHFNNISSRNCQNRIKTMERMRFMIVRDAQVEFLRYAY